MQVVEPSRNSRVHALQLRNRVASRLYRHQASQLHPGGMAAGLSHVTEEKMMGDVTFFIVLMGWFGERLSSLISVKYGVRHGACFMIVGYCIGDLTWCMPCLL